MRATGLAVWMTTAITASAQAPAITPHSIVNAASFTSPALPGGAIARGSLFSVSGQNLGPPLLAQPSAPPLRELTERRIGQDHSGQHRRGCHPCVADRQ